MGPKWEPRWARFGPRRGSQEGPKEDTSPRGPQGPSSPSSSSRPWPQERPKRPPESPKRAPGERQESPKRTQESPKRAPRETQQEIPTKFPRRSPREPQESPERELQARPKRAPREPQEHIGPLQRIRIVSVFLSPVSISYPYPCCCHSFHPIISFAVGVAGFSIWQ